MKTLILTIPLPAQPSLSKHFGASVIVCTKGHAEPAHGHIAETYFYSRDDVPRGGPSPTPLDIEMIGGCLARLMATDADSISSYAVDIYRRADAFLSASNIGTVLFRTGPHLPHEMAIHQIAKRDSKKIGMYEETSYFSRTMLFPGLDRKSLDSALWISTEPYKLDGDQTAALSSSTELKKYYFGIYKAKQNKLPDIAKSAFVSTAAVIKSNLSGSPLAGTSRACDNPLRPSLTGALGFWTKNISGVIASERNFNASVEPSTIYADLRDDDVVFYGNYAPERTVFPDSYPYHGFISALRELNDFRKRIWREHPTQFTLPNRPYMLRGGFYKGPSFYEAIQREGWAIGSLDFPSEALLQSDAMIATLNGTVAFEAMLKRRPLILFAKNWYLDLPNVSTASARTFVLDYDPVDVAATAFARTFPRIDFWNLQASDLRVVERAVELITSQGASQDPH